MELPNKHYIEHLVEVSSLERDISLYPSPFKFQVPLKDNYRFIVKIELLQAEFYICDGNELKINKDKYKLNNLNSNEVKNRFINLKNLYLSIDELNKGNFDSSNPNINQAFCSFKNLKIGDNNFYDSKEYSFPKTIYPNSAPMPGLNRLTLTLHPSWVKEPYPCFENINKNFIYPKIFLHTLNYKSDCKEFSQQIISKIAI